MPCDEVPGDLQTQAADSLILIGCRGEGGIMFIHATAQVYSDPAGGPKAHRVTYNFVAMIDGDLKGDMDNVTVVSDGDATTVMAKVGNAFRTDKADSSKWELGAMHGEIEAILRDKLFQ
jgi:hypothetical protein